MLEIEIWKPIERTEGKYEISSFGNIRNSKNKKILKVYKHKLGYFVVVVKLNGRKGGCLLLKIHREVAKAFVENNKEENNVVNHLDGCKTNNHFSNLEWTTHVGNVKHAVDTGLIKTGENVSNSKLTNEDVIFIKNNLHLTNKELSEKFKVHYSIIWRIRVGKHRIKN